MSSSELTDPAPAAATLAGRLALVTGASRGYGAAIAVSLARHGAHVILLARTVGGLEAVDDRIQAAGGAATLMPFDLLRLDDIAALGPTIYERFGKLDILVANAATLGHLGPVAHFESKAWDRAMATNLTANQRLLQTLDPLLRAAEAGKAIFIADGAAALPSAYGGAYAVSKAAFEKMVELYAAETRKTRLRVNLVDPGPMATALRAQAYPGEDRASLPDPDTCTGPVIILAEKESSSHGELIRLNPVSAP